MGCWVVERERGRESRESAGKRDDEKKEEKGKVESVKAEMMRDRDRTGTFLFPFCLSQSALDLGQKGRTWSRA